MNKNKYENVWNKKKKAKEIATKETTELEKQLKECKDKVKQLSAALKTRQNNGNDNANEIKDINTALTIIEHFFQSQNSTSLQ